MTDHIKVSTREEAGVSVEAVYTLFQEAFRQWTEHGIEAAFLHYTLESFKRSIHNAIVFVAVDTETGELLGTHTLQPNRKKNYVHDCFLAVSPKAKHTGIATRMLQVEEEYICKEGYNYLRCITSVHAYWSVNWHRKMGYRIIGYRRFPGNNYDDYIYRKQLTPSLFWSGPLAPVTAYLHFLVPYTFTRLCKTSSGELNLLGKMAKKVVWTIKRK